MLHRHLLTTSAVFRPAVVTRSLSYAAFSPVPARSSILRGKIASKAPQASASPIRWFSQTFSASDAAEASDAAKATTSTGVAQSEDPNAPDFVLPEGHSLRRTSKGELKIRPPKDNTFASLKGSFEYDIWKAITVSPMKYTNMSAVQESVLHLLPELASSIGANAEPMPDGLGRDLLVKARTGTGKTIAFLVPALEARYRSLTEVRRGQFTKPWKDMLSRHKPDFDYEKLDKHGRDNLVKQFANNTVGVLIMSPTRELATQIAEEAKKLLHHDQSMRVQLLVGGANRSRQIEDWRRSRPDVVVATPGRILDLLQDVGMIREAMSACRTLVLDEADTLLEMGFREDIQSIMKHLPAKEDRQNMLFSATVSPEIQSIARATLDRNFRFIDCVPAGEENVHKHIPQYATVLESGEEQFPHILRLIAHDQLVNPRKSKVIVFAPTTKMTQLVADVLRDARSHLPASRGCNVYEIHSKKDQRARFNTSDRFRQDRGGASILVTSDVSARGVDYPGTSRVIQIGVPSSKDQYIHRIGRTGRAGASGRADIVLQSWERGFLHFQLDDLPVEELPTKSLVEEVQALCERFDAAPAQFGASDEGTANGKDQRKGLDRKLRTSREAPKLQGPLTDKFLNSTLAPLVRDSVSRLEPDELRETFTSLIGFYIARTSELRTSKSLIFEGLKRWCVESAGMEEPPYCSDSFLSKLGIDAPSRSGGRFGAGRQRDFPRRDTGGNAYRPGVGGGSYRDRGESGPSSFGRDRFNRAGPSSGRERQFGRSSERFPRGNSAAADKW